MKIKSPFLGIGIIENTYHNRMEKVNKKNIKLKLFRCILMFGNGSSEVYNFVKDFEDLEKQIKLYTTYEVDMEEVKKAWSDYFAKNY